MWTLVYAYVLAGSIQMYTLDYKFDTLAECQVYAEEVLAEELEGVDNEEYMWECL
jgi:hypothetical protein